MTKNIKDYTTDEKAKIIFEALKGELTIAQISHKFGVPATEIAFWKKEALEDIVTGFKAKLKIKDTSNEELMRHLYEQISQIAAERD